MRKAFSELSGSGSSRSIIALGKLHHYRYVVTESRSIGSTFKPASFPRFFNLRLCVRPWAFPLLRRDELGRRERRTSARGLSMRVSKCDSRRLARASGLG
eukprot:scaffold1307_cov200-Pinguiococcus_pyrenoidosus.AAC.98